MLQLLSRAVTEVDFELLETPCSSPSQESYGMFSVSSLEEIDSLDNSHFDTEASTCNIDRFIHVSFYFQGEEVAVIFCGDFNAGPISGSVQLITRGSVPSTHANWWSGELSNILHAKFILRIVNICIFYLFSKPRWCR